MGLLSSVGGLVNDVLGGTSSAKQAQKYQMQQMAMQNFYNEKYAKNAHQWEVQDLQNAGLNPALSAGGSSAGAIAGSSVSGGGAIGSANGNIGDLMGAIGTLSQMKLNNASSAKASADAAQTIEGLEYVKPEKRAQLENMISNTMLNNMKKHTEAAQQGYLNEMEKYTKRKASGKHAGGSISAKGISGEITW